MLCKMYKKHIKQYTFKTKLINEVKFSENFLAQNAQKW